MLSPPPYSGTVFDLLAQRPEQEQTLLSLLVNKLGDPERKVASRSSFYLLKLGRSVLPVVHFLPLLYYLPMVYFLFWCTIFLLCTSCFGVPSSYGVLPVLVSPVFAVWLFTSCLVINFLLPFQLRSIKT